VEHFWQKRYYDFNVRNYTQFVEKLRYIHRNPVKQGLCERPENWKLGGNLGTDGTYPKF
jgi:putative transposase